MSMKLKKTSHNSSLCGERGLGSTLEECKTLLKLLRSTPKMQLQVKESAMDQIGSILYREISINLSKLYGKWWMIISGAFHAKTTQEEKDFDADKKPRSNLKQEELQVQEQKGPIHTIKTNLKEVNIPQTPHGIFACT